MKIYRLLSNKALQEKKKTENIEPTTIECGQINFARQKPSQMYSMFPTDTS